MTCVSAPARGSGIGSCPGGRDTVAEGGSSESYDTAARHLVTGRIMERLTVANRATVSRWTEALLRRPAGQA